MSTTRPSVPPSPPPLDKKLVPLLSLLRTWWSIPFPPAVDPSFPTLTCSYSCEYDPVARAAYGPKVITTLKEAGVVMIKRAKSSNLARTQSERTQVVALVNAIKRFYCDVGEIKLVIGIVLRALAATLVGTSKSHGKTDEGVSLAPNITKWLNACDSKELFSESFSSYAAADELMYEKIERGGFKDVYMEMSWARNTLKKGGDNFDQWEIKLQRTVDAFEGIELPASIDVVAKVFERNKPPMVWGNLMS